jgi:hypothetical protein
MKTTRFTAEERKLLAVLTAARSCGAIPNREAPLRLELRALASDACRNLPSAFPTHTDVMLATEPGARVIRRG